MRQPWKCFRCLQPPHHSNECLELTSVQLIKGELELEGSLDTPIKDLNDVFGDESEFISCILERILLDIRQRTLTQWHFIFWTCCMINLKVCDLVIDDRCTENIIDMHVVNSLQIKMTLHPQPYKINWVELKFLWHRCARYPLALARTIIAKFCAMSSI